jgi:signal transduction histidine kinase
VRLIEILRTHTFRTAAMASAAFGATTLLLFGFIYWQTAILETNRIDGFILHEMTVLSHEDTATMAADVNTRYRADLHRQSFAAIFDPEGTRIAGDLRALPSTLPHDGLAHHTVVLRPASAGPALDMAQAVARRLPNGNLLVVGRSEADIASLRALVARALGLGLLPALLASLAIGLLASRRTIGRVHGMNRSIERIMRGHLNERLPAANGSDALEQLATSCNRMLGEIERLLGEVKGVGENIAHDLRAPLTRLRTRMEIGRLRGQDKAALERVLEQSIEDLDRGLAVITALLRIGELETGRRQAAFAPVNLCDLMQEVGELYAPLVADRGLRFGQSPFPVAAVTGDRALLLEVVVNLLDNAVKFAPLGGSVSISVLQEASGPVLRVADSGQGIAAEDVSAVLERFYRAEPNRRLEGHGVGLNLVSAILRLHGFGIRMSSEVPGVAPGFAIDILCWPHGGAAHEAAPVCDQVKGYQRKLTKNIFSSVLGVGPTPWKTKRLT